VLQHELMQVALGDAVVDQQEVRTIIEARPSGPRMPSCLPLKAIELLPGNVRAEVAPVLVQVRLVRCVLALVEGPQGNGQASSHRKQFFRAPLQPVVFFGDSFFVQVHRPPLRSYDE
jgi:hypothetical protein